MKTRHTPRDPAAEEFSEDMADLLHHRATVPATIWSVLVLAACLAALLDDEPTPQARQQLASAAASAVPVSAPPGGQ